MIVPVQDATSRYVQNTHTEGGPRDFGSSNSQSSLPFDSELEFAAEMHNLQGGVQAALALSPSPTAGSEI